MCLGIKSIPGWRNNTWEGHKMGKNIMSLGHWKEICVKNPKWGAKRWHSTGNRGSERSHKISKTKQVPSSRAKNKSNLPNSTAPCHGINIWKLLSYFFILLILLIFKMNIQFFTILWLLESESSVGHGRLRSLQDLRLACFLDVLVAHDSIVLQY